MSAPESVSADAFELAEMESHRRRGRPASRRPTSAGPEAFRHESSRGGGCRSSRVPCVWCRGRRRNPAPSSRWETDRRRPPARAAADSAAPRGRRAPPSSIAASCGRSRRDRRCGCDRRRRGRSRRWDPLRIAVVLAANLHDLFARDDRPAPQACWRRRARAPVAGRGQRETSSRRVAGLASRLLVRRTGPRLRVRFGRRRRCRLLARR